MLTSMSSGAILSKTRAMFGRRMTISDYGNLASKGSIEQAASYLKKHPAYADVLADINDSTIHRRELENLIRQRHYVNFESLCRYELSIGERLADYILLTSEIELIIEALSRVASGRTDETAVITASPYLDRHITIDLQLLEKAKDYDDVLQAVKESKFYQALYSLRSQEWDTSLGLMKYESALSEKYNKYMLNIFENSIDNGTKKVLLEMFKTKIDLTNFVHIIRLKEYFNVSEEHAKFAVISGGGMSKRLIDEMLDAENVEEVFDIAGKDRYLSKKLHILDKCNYIDELPERYVFEKSYKEIYFSPHPAVVMISYLNISSVEISNIIKIIEGIRYKIPPDDIMNLLILHENINK